MRMTKMLWIGVPAIFLFAVAAVIWGPGPKPKPAVHVRSIAVLANRSNPEDLERARQKIEGVYESLEKGGNFKKLAKEKSEAENARQEGDMGWRGWGTLPPNHEEVAFTLEPGKYSEIITVGKFYIAGKTKNDHSN